MNQNCDNTYKSDPVKISPSDPYLEIMCTTTSNTGTAPPITGTDSCQNMTLSCNTTNFDLPLIKLEDTTNLNVKGVKGPVSIVKCRKIAYETLVRSLYSIATPSKSSIPGIYVDKKGIKIIINKQGKQNISESFELCNYGDKAFDNANVDELEGDNNDEPKKKKEKGYGLTRENLNDKNIDILTIDLTIFKIITMLFSLRKTNLKSNIETVLQNFIITSSIKEYLDTGQLYAIYEPTLDDNKKIDYGVDAIIRRIGQISTAATTTTKRTRDTDSDVPTLPKQPMLETIDGAATRIAADNSFLAYCKFVLKDTIFGGSEKTLDASFYIDRSDVYLLGLLNSKNSNIIGALKEYSKDNIDMQKLIDLFKTTTNNGQLIDLCVYALSNPGLTDLLKRVQSKFFNQNVILIDNEFYFCASVASFIYQSHIKKGMMNKGLINCNFDSLCHDNGKSKTYRLVMIMMFILKNNTEDIKIQLKEMFPIFFNDKLSISTANVTNVSSKRAQTSVQTSDTEFKEDTFLLVWDKVNEIEINGQSLFKEQSEYKKFIDIYFGTLTEDQKKIFKILAYYNADNIEEGLYRKLQVKSCYVFPVLHSPYVAIVRCQDSAHKAFIPAQQSLTNPNKIFKLSALDQGVIIPHYVNCAIDAPLKHGLSLSNYDLNGQESQVWVTAVTRVDAASQNMSNAYHYIKPICIKIDIKNIDRSFAYKYNYGKTSYSLLTTGNNKREIDCSGVPQNFCDIYKNLYRELQETKFYFSKNKEFKNLTTASLDNLLTQIAVIPEVDPKIRDAFSRLISDGIIGTTKDKTVSKSSLDNAINKFFDFFVKYMKLDNNEKNIRNKKIVIIALYKLLRITREVSDINNLPYLINTDLLDEFNIENIIKSSIFFDKTDDISSAEKAAAKAIAIAAVETPEIAVESPEAEYARAVRAAAKESEAVEAAAKTKAAAEEAEEVAKEAEAAEEAAKTKVTARAARAAARAARAQPVVAEEAAKEEEEAAKEKEAATVAEAATVTAREARAAAREAAKTAAIYALDLAREAAKTKYADTTAATGVITRAKAARKLEEAAAARKLEEPEKETANNKRLKIGGAAPAPAPVAVGQNQFNNLAVDKEIPFNLDLNQKPVQKQEPVQKQKQELVSLVEPVQKQKQELEPVAEPVVAAGIISAEDTLYHNLETTYTSMFGKYGFDMAINEDGEYELNILDTQEQYDAYLRKYELTEQVSGPQVVGSQVVGSQVVGSQVVGPQVVEQVVGSQVEQVVGQGGNIRRNTKTKTKKKHKRVKHNTKRISKVRLNKSKRNAIRNATKTRSRN